MMKETIKDRVPIYAKTTGLRRFIFCINETVIIPIKLEKKVVIKIGTKTSVLLLINGIPSNVSALFERVLNLKAKIEIGIKVNPEVFRTRNII